MRHPPCPVPGWNVVCRPLCCLCAHASLRAHALCRIGHIVLNRVPRRQRCKQRPLQRDNRPQGTVPGQYRCPAPGIAECRLFGCCPHLIWVCYQVCYELCQVCSPVKNQPRTGIGGRQLPQVTHTNAHVAGSVVMRVGCLPSCDMRCVLSSVPMRNMGWNAHIQACCWPCMRFHCWRGARGVCGSGLGVLGTCTDAAHRCNMPDNQPQQSKRKREQEKEAKEKKKQRMRGCREPPPAAR